MPGSAAHTAGTEFTQCAAVATMPGLLFEPGLDAFRLEALDGDRKVRIAADLHFVAFTDRPECPSGVEVFLPHQPVHRDAHDGFTVHKGFPVEPPARDLTGLDHAHRRVDGRGGHGDLLRRAHGGIGPEPESVDDTAGRPE